jgi:hypothetical protein
LQGPVGFEQGFGFAISSAGYGTFVQLKVSCPPVSVHVSTKYFPKGRRSLPNPEFALTLTLAFCPRHGVMVSNKKAALNPHVPIEPLLNQN